MVADDVRLLAQCTKESTTEIQTMIENQHKVTNEEAAKSLSDKTFEPSTSLKQLAKKLQNVISGFKV